MADVPTIILLCFRIHWLQKDYYKDTDRLHITDNQRS